MNSKAKKWLSLDDQLELLSNRGMRIDDPIRAKQHLRFIGYYRLSGYAYPFKTKPCSNEFQAGTSFKDVLALYNFDMQLRTLTMAGISVIETALCSQIAYTLGKYDPYAHLTVDLLKTEAKTQHEKWIRRYERSVSQNGDLPFIKHHNHNYNGLIPIWACVEIWDFGMLAHMFKLLQYRDQAVITTTCSNLLDGASMSSHLFALNHIRNICAHHGRLWNANLVRSANKTEAFLPSTNRHRAFYYLCLIAHLISHVAPMTHWARSLQHLIKDFPTPDNSAVLVKDMGISDEAAQFLSLLTKKDD